MLALVLLVAGGLLSWGSGFAHTQVHDQLASQKIFFPGAGSEALSAKEFPTLQRAFDTVGTIAEYASYATFAGAALLLVMALLGFAHLRRTPDEAVVGAVPAAREPIAV